MTDYKSSLLRLLDERGYIHQLTDATGLDALAAQQIVPGYIALNWYAIAAPRATPPAIIARMADSQFSLLAKGLAFIAVGVAFLAFNFFMSRHQRQQHAAQA